MNDIRVTVGTEDGDFVGTTHRALQAAVDYVASFGKGTVQVLPGTYHMGNALHLRDRVRLIGSGRDTILLKNPSRTTPLIDDTDWYDWHATVQDPSCFEVGGGILLRAQDPHGGTTNYSKHTVVAIDGNVIRLDSQPRKNMWITHQATAATLYPIVTGNWIEDIQIRALVLDGNRAHNDLLDGNYGGCIFMQDCKRVHIANVIARNNHGDGISWQICHDVTVERCISENHQGLGLHPGSGSRRPTIRHNQIRDCRIGIFWCWGVKGGLAEDNEICNCRDYGISIGHRDTDNIMRHNRVYRSGKAGLYFRPEEPAIRAAHRNVIEDNLFEDSGTAEAPGTGIDLAAAVDGTVLKGNRIVNSDAGHTQIGIRIAPEVTHLTLSGNEIVNVPQAVQDERETAQQHQNGDLS